MNPGICKLSPAQDRLVESLESVLHLATCGLRSSLAIRPRTHTMIVGPSGSGKSFIVNELASRMKIPIWHENISNWSPIGARGNNPTLSSLIRWLESIEKGIIFLDEADKINFPSEFSNCSRTEIFSLLDHRIPDGALTTFDLLNSDPFDSEFSSSHHQPTQRVLVEQKLRDHILIVAAGAWQSGWDSQKQIIGFHSHSPQEATVGRGVLLQSIMPELLQRFRSRVLFLEPMQEEDYLSVVKSQLNFIPKLHRERYRRMILAAIPVAIEQGLGMRIFEEVYSDFCTWLLEVCRYDYFVFEDVLKNY
jgi:hypothetical protein